MLITLIIGALLFACAGTVYALRWHPSLSVEGYISARGEIGRWSTIFTLFASAMGSWVLFGPAEAATWGGIPAIAGYAIGSVLPLLLYIPLGRRLRTLMPEGHALTEYVRIRYGRAMHVITLLIMLFYLLLALTAQVTGMGLIMQLVADVPLWLTAGIVLVTTVAYTTLGGLRASIFTDGFQTLLLLPLIAGVLVVAFVAIGGAAPTIGRLADTAPELLRWDFAPGIEGGAALIIGIMAASVFNQGNWQRVYAADSIATLRTSFLVAAAAIMPVVAVMGWLGLASVGAGQADPPSVALFGLLLSAAPDWIGLMLLVLGLTLVMSSADTVMNAFASLVTTDLRQALPGLHADSLLRVARWTTAFMALPVFVIAAQGYSVLYLFLVANLVCAAALVPVFGGLYSTRITSRAAIAGTAVGLVAGGWLFPAPGSAESLLPAFAASLLLPCAVIYLMTRRKGETFDLEALHREVRVME